MTTDLQSASGSTARSDWLFDRFVRQESQRDVQSTNHYGQDRNDCRIISDDFVASQVRGHAGKDEKDIDPDGLRFQGMLCFHVVLQLWKDVCHLLFVMG